MSKIDLLLTLLALCTLSLASATQATEQPPLSGSKRFEEHTGQTLYQGICQGCHMSSAQGAEGAGRYPTLANNSRLAAADYPIYMVSLGDAGMPGFKEYLSDEQIAEVVNYVRTHFNNNYNDTVQIKDVKKITQR